jgi:hypothetical protein
MESPRYIFALALLWLLHPHLAECALLGGLRVWDAQFARRLDEALTLLIQA